MTQSVSVVDRGIPLNASVSERRTRGRSFVYRDITACGIPGHVGCKRDAADVFETFFSLATVPVRWTLTCPTSTGKSRAAANDDGSDDI